MTTLTTGGAERGAMVLRQYDPDDRDRLTRILTDLVEYAEDAGLNFAGAAVYAVQIAAERRSKTLTEQLVVRDVPRAETVIHDCRNSEVCFCGEDDLDDAIFRAERYGEPIPGATA